MSPNDPGTDPTKQDPSLDQGVLSSKQVPGSPNHDSPFANVIPATVQLTTPMYILSKPKPVQELYDITGSQGPSFAEKRLIGAMALAQQGYVVDLWPDGYGNDPVVTMLLRQEMFIESVQCIGLFASIKTSLDPKDYPPMYPPPPPPPPAGTPSIKLVGNFQYNDGTQRWFGAGPGALHAYAAGIIKNGGTWTEGFAPDSVKFTYTVHITDTLMGTAISFSLPNLG